MSLAVSLFVTVVISALALSALWYFEVELKNTISRHQFAMVSAMAAEIDSKIQNAQLGLIAVAETAAPDLAGNPPAAQRFLDTHTGIRTVFDSSIFIFSPAGRLIAASPAEPRLQGKDYSFREYVRNTIATGRPQISMPILSTQSHHHPIVMFTSPFFDTRGKMTGILAGALDLMRDNFLGKLATVKLGEKGYLYLYSTDRTLIVHHDRTRILRRDVPVGANRLFDLAITGFEGTGETVTSRGLHALSSFKRLKSKNWILAANFPQEEAYAPINRAKWYLLGASVMALILSNIIVWWSMRYFTAPLLLFTRHVKGITGREHDPEPIRLASEDEIGTLARAFNEMLAELDQQKKTIRLQKEFSENLLLNSAIPTFVLDTRHRVIIWNKACEEMTGMKGEQILGTTDQWKAFYRKERTVLADIVINGNTGDLPLYYESHNNSPFTPDGLQAEGWCLTSDNRERYLFFDAAPVRNAGGEIIAVIETVQDITERRRAEQELRKAHKLESLGVLAGGIAHDFNNLLTGILGNISLAKIMTESNTKPFKRLDEAEKAVSRARGLTQQLMTFSKGGAPVKKTASMEQIVKDSVSFVLSGSNVSCRFSVPDDIWPVEADDGQMNQVINNLIINADQSMADGGIIEVCFENLSIAADNEMSLKEGRYVKITIRDHGAGIPEQYLHRIFDPYFTTKRKGSGLGLATVYSIIRNHDGYVGVESKVGTGTTFRIYIPASENRLPEIMETEEILHGGSGKILVMDDEEIIRDVAADILGHLGYSAVACCDGSEAIELYRQAITTKEPFTAVIMDLTIPGGMGGREAAARILEVDPDALLIVSSGYSNDPVIANFHHYGFSGVVAKPFDAEGLAKELKRLIPDSCKPVCKSGQGGFLS
jgi:PAS domain S-box-containing protein